MNEPGLAARKAALAIVTGVLRKRRPLDAQLEQLKALAPRDAGFARALASQTLAPFRRTGSADPAFRSQAAGAAQGRSGNGNSAAGRLRASDPESAGPCRRRCRQPAGRRRCQGGAFQIPDQCRAAAGVARRRSVLRDTGYARGSTRPTGCGSAGRAQYGEDMARAIARAQSGRSAAGHHLEKRRFGVSRQRSLCSANPAG